MADTLAGQPAGIVAPAAVPEGKLLRLRLIGQMEAWTADAQSVLPPGRKTRGLLAIVALSAPRPALRSRLAELLWSRRPEEQARASLRQEIHRLLETLSVLDGEILNVTRDHISLRSSAVWVDVDEVMRASVEQPESLGLLDGELLDDLDGVDPAFDAWLTTERERLRDRARSVAEALLRESAEPEGVIAAAQRVLQIDRAHEGAWRALMRAYAERGERGMAVQAYDRCRAVLADLLDTAPSQETQKLLSEIRGPYGSRIPVARGVAAPSASAAPAPVPEETAPPIPRNGAVPEPPANRGGAYLGIMPPQVIGSTEDVASFGPGLANEITTALARFRWIFTVPPSSLARFSGVNRDEAAIRRTFNVDFLLDGSVQRFQDQLRASMRLIDVQAGNQVVWAERFDTEPGNLLELQDEIASTIAAQVDSEILSAGAARAQARAGVSPSPYERMLRALPLIARLEREAFAAAGEDLVEAIRSQPDLAPAYAWDAWWHVLTIDQGWAGDFAGTAAEAGRLAERAIVFDPYDARGLAIAGHVRAALHGRLREAVALHDRAVSLNPHLAMAWSLSGLTQAWLGNLEEAERRVARYRTLLPRDPHGLVHDSARVLIALLKRDLEGATMLGRALTETHPVYLPLLKPYLAALGHLGRTEEAVGVLAILLEHEPAFTVERFLATSPLQDAAHRSFYAEGLRHAGVVDGR